jgi:hypothetical protein
VKKKKNLKTASNEKLFLVAFQNNQFKYNWFFYKKSDFHVEHKTASAFYKNL